MEVRCQCNLNHFSIPFTRPQALVVCHCDRCKVMTGSVYHIAALFPWFDIGNPESGTNANLSTFRQTSESGNTMLGHFCKGCGSRLVHTDGGGGKDWTSVSAARIVDFDWKLLENKDLTTHCWTKSAVVEVPKGFRAFEEQLRW